MQAHLSQSTPTLNHFQTMMGPLGMYQHSTRKTPLLSEGYCTDDNARAVQVLVYLKNLLDVKRANQAESFLARGWKFIRQAEIKSGEYLNFRTVEGDWLPTGVSDDMHARLARCFVSLIEHDTSKQRCQEAKTMLERLLPTIAKLSAPRALAEIVLALSQWSNADARITMLQQQCVARLLTLWHDNFSSDWPWFERAMTYANAILPHGLLSMISQRSDLKEALHASTDFLISTTIQDKVFIPIGSRGWYPKGGSPSRDNQQPIEAGTMFDFLIDYDHAFPGRLTTQQITAPYLWFFGLNTHQQIMVDRQTGSCYDGLFFEGPNRNCGAESLLAYWWAEVRLRAAPGAVQNYVYQERQKLLTGGASVV